MSQPDSNIADMYFRRVLDDVCARDALAKAERSESIAA